MQAVIAHGALLQSYLAIDETLLDPFGCYLKAPRGKKGKSQWASKVAAMKDASDRSRIVGIAVGCAALLGGMMAVMVGTTETATFHVAGNDPPTPGASALARPHQPLDRAPGEPLAVPLAGERTARHAGSFGRRP